MDKYLSINKEQKNRFVKIRRAYIDKKYDEVIKEANIFLLISPKEVDIRFMRAKSYRFKGMFDEAIDDLKYNLTIEENAHSIVELYYIYYYLNRYEEALELVPILKRNNYIMIDSLRLSELIMRKQLGLPINVIETTYITKQVLDYDINRSLEHITKKHKGTLTDKNTIFNDNVDLKNLIDFVANNIENSQKENIEELLEIHYFALSNAGYSENGICNFIKAVVIPNTNSIISIYPVDNIRNAKFTDLNCFREQIIKEEKEYVKKKSRIDRFNQKYNI